MSTNQQSIAIETPQNWGKSYELIDAGGQNPCPKNFG